MIFPILCMSVDDNRAHCLSKNVFLKKILIPDYRGLIVKKGIFFLLYSLLLNGSKDLPNFLHECRGQQGPLFEKDCSSEKILNPGLQGIKCPKRCFSYFFGLYSKTALMFFPILCMSVEDNRAHCLSKIVFLKQLLIPDYRGLSD